MMKCIVTYYNCALKALKEGTSENKKSLDQIIKKIVLMFQGYSSKSKKVLFNLEDVF